MTRRRKIAIHALNYAAIGFAFTARWLAGAADRLDPTSEVPMPGMPGAPGPGVMTPVGGSLIVAMPQPTPGCNCPRCHVLREMGATDASELH